jgi:hypothetical protein
MADSRSLIPCSSAASFFTSPLIFASSVAVHSFSANEVGHTDPSTRLSESLKPDVAYLVVELLGDLKKADHLAFLGICGRSKPGPRREGRRAGDDDRREPLGHRAIRFPPRVDGRKNGAFPVLFPARIFGWPVQ